MAYFRNSVVNLINLHYGIFAIVMTGGGAFYCVYLLKAGVPLPAVLAAMAAILGARFAVRPIVVPLAVRIGLQKLLILGTAMVAAQFPIIAWVHGLGWPLVALIIVSAIGDAVYWPSYHAYFAALGDHEHRGHQISMREAIAALVGIVSPIVTGWLLVTFGPMAAFGATAIVMLLAVLPLLWTPEVKVEAKVRGAYRAAVPGIKLFIADGWIGSGYVFLWQVALFISLQQSFINYGGALAIAACVGAILGLLLGRTIDAGHGVRAVILAMAIMMLIVLLRAGFHANPVLAVAVNALTAIGTCLYTPTLMTAVYNQAKRSPCTLRFHVATEGGWDSGGAAGCLCAALLLWQGVPIAWVLLLPLAGVAANFIQLRRYYRDNPLLDVEVPEDAALSLTAIQQRDRP